MVVIVVVVVVVVVVNDDDDDDEATVLFFFLSIMGACYSRLCKSDLDGKYTQPLFPQIEL